MDVESLMHRLNALLSELGADTKNVGADPYVSLALDGLVSILNVIRAAELTIAAGASRATVDNMLRAHMLGRMQREAVLMGRLAEQPTTEREVLLRARQAETHTPEPDPMSRTYVSEPDPRPRKPRPRPGAYGPAES